MEKGVYFLFILLFSLNLVFALSHGDEWDKFEDFEEIEEPLDEGGVDKEAGEESNEDYIVDTEGVSDNLGDTFFTEYTQEFYIAIGLGILGLFIMVYLFYSFLIRPKNKWKK
tara:strand:- start:657 stop:992 length:336 start_codon:yes stop_codon:yes gene_type:complete